MKYIITYCVCCCLLFIYLDTAGQNRYIKEVDPALGHSGQQINIKGAGFEAGDRVFFGGVEGNVISITDQLIEAAIPAGTTFDNITVLNTNSDLIYYSNKRFLLSYGGDHGVVQSDFDAQVDIFAESGLYDVCLCDLDGDLKNDIAAANAKTNKATLLQNLSTPGNISFGKTPLSLGASTLNVTCGDLTGDGKPEVVFTEGSNGSRVFVLVNFSTPGSLSFTLSTISISGSSTKRVALRDLDLDGKPDLVVTDQSTNKVYLIKNTTSGGVFSFDSNITTLTVQSAVSTAGLEIEDLNNDRRPEIIVNQFLTDGGGFYVATNQSTSGSFSFSNFKQFNSNGTFVNIKVADVNNDDKPDIAATLFLSSSVAVFLNQTSNDGDPPAFAAAQNLSTDARPWGLDFGDIDGDKKKDLIVTTIGGDLSLDILNNNTTSNTLDFQKVSLPVTYINRNVKVGDIDGDSKPDIVFASVDDESNSINASNISILRNNRCIKPEITYEGPLTVCTGNTVQLEAQLIQGATYEWRKDGAIEKTGADNFLDVSSTGDYTVTLITEAGSCSEISEIVTVNVQAAGALPSPTVSTNDPVCIGGNLTLTSSNIGATTYEWRGPQGFSDTGISVTLNNFQFDNTGRYYLDVYSGTCIIETKSVVVEAIASPDFTASQAGSGIYCPGDPVTLTVSPNDTDFSYQWFDDSGVITGATGINFSPTTSGNYYAEASDLINTSCPSIATNNVAVNFVDLPQPDFDYPSTACIGSAVQFTDQSTIDSNAQANYSWEFGDGSTSTNQNPVYSYNAEGTFNITLTVNYSSLSCSDQITKAIDVNGSLDIEIDASATTFCEGDSVTLSVDDSFNTYVWNTGENTPTITTTEGGDYSVIVANGIGCEGSDNITLEKFPAPIVELSASDNNIAPGDTILLNASGLLSYNWSPDSVLLNISGAEAEASLYSTTLIKVNGQGENGCPGEAEINITVLQDQIGNKLKPKKFFSPNNDALSEYWEIERIEEFTQCGVEVYDQEGNKIFESKPYLNDWDGTSKGRQVPDGVYYYVIKCDEQGIVKSGSITLLR